MYYYDFVKQNFVLKSFQDSKIKKYVIHKYYKYYLFVLSPLAKIKNKIAFFFQYRNIIRYYFHWAAYGLRGR